MNNTQFEGLKSTLTDKKLFGQFVGIVTVTGKDLFTAANFKAGYRVVTRWNVRISKKEYVEVVNSSTGAVELGATFTPLRPSYYEGEAQGIFFSHLISNPEKKYIRIVFDADTTPEVKSVYVDPQGNVIGDCIESVKDLITPSAYKKATEGYGREKVLRTAGINVEPRSFCAENVAELTICGNVVIDALLKHFIKYVK